MALAVAPAVSGPVAADGGHKLGNGTWQDSEIPVRVCAVGATNCTANPLTNATAIGAAGDHSAAVVAGTVVAWGENAYGQLGDATTTNRTSPVRVCAVNATDRTANPLTGVTGIALGYSHSWRWSLVEPRSAGAPTGPASWTTARRPAAPGWVCAHGQSDCVANPLTGVTALASGYSHNLAVVGA